MMMKRKILVTGEIFDLETATDLASDFTLVTAAAELTESQLIEKLSGAGVYVLGGDETVTSAVLDSPEAADLRLIVFLGVQPDTFFTPEALNQLVVKGIELKSTPAANSNAVAEMTVALMLAQLRNIIKLADDVRGRRWAQYQAGEMYGKVLGIYGMGSIGFLVAEKAKALGMSIIYTGRRPVEAAERKLGAKLVDKAALFSNSDIISLHLPLTADTTNLVGRDDLRSMKPSSILVNTARPGLVDPEALLRALDQRWISSAAFDGYYLEGPNLGEADPFGLLSLPVERFLCTPHQAFNTREANEKASRIAARLIRESFAAEGSNG